MKKINFKEIIKKLLDAANQPFLDMKRTGELPPALQSYLSKQKLLLLAPIGMCILLLILGTGITAVISMAICEVCVYAIILMTTSNLINGQYSVYIGTVEDVEISRVSQTVGFFNKWAKKSRKLIVRDSEGILFQVNIGKGFNNIVENMVIRVFAQNVSENNGIRFISSFYTICQVSPNEMAQLSTKENNYKEKHNKFVSALSDDDFDIELNSIKDKMRK